MDRSSYFYYERVIHLLHVNELTKTYDGVTNQLDRVTATFPRGQWTTILGPNGSGKSTLLRALARTHEPTSGTYTIEGERADAMPLKAFARRVATVHQQNEAPFDLTVERLVRYGRLPYETLFSRPTERDDEAVDWAMRETDVYDKRKQSFGQLSGGERQRVWIALALAQQTDVLLLDEPTNHLDAYYQYDMLDLLKRLNRTHGLTIVTVLHDMNQALRYSDQLLLLERGRLVARGTPRDVLTERIVRDVYGIRLVIREEEGVGPYAVTLGKEER